MDAPADPAKLRAVLERLEAEESRRRAEKVAAGEIVSIPLFIVAGSETEARLRAEQAQADKLSELRAAGETREIIFAVTMVRTGVVRHGEAADAGRVPAAPSFLPALNSAAAPRLSSRTPPDANEDIRAARVPKQEAPQPPIIESFVQVQVRRCRDEDDPGEVAQAWFSVDAGTLTLTGTDGKHITSRAMIPGEDPKALARKLLRKKKQPSDFDRPLSYPSAGLA
jgi:hypothetical protein